jgi:hypothetical protein
LLAYESKGLLGGFAEPVGLILTIILVFLTPLGTADFWLTLAALLGLIGMQVTCWLFTHPVNKFWLQGQKISGLSSGFFSFGANRSRPQNETRSADWTDLRDQWEYSHVARAGLALASLTAPDRHLGWFLAADSARSYFYLVVSGSSENSHNC